MRSAFGALLMSGVLLVVVPALQRPLRPLSCLRVELSKEATRTPPVLAIRTAPEPALALSASPSPSSQPTPLPPLQATLLGTVIGSQPTNSKALIHETTTNQRRVLVCGDVVQHRVLSDIGRGFITLLRPDGTQEQVFLDETTIPEPFIQPLGPDTYRVHTQRLAASIKRGATSLRAHVQLLPHLERGRLVGFILARIEPTSPIAQAGFSTNDLITAVNGMPLDSLPAVQAIYQAMRASRELSVEITRDGEPLTLHYVLDY